MTPIEEKFVLLAFLLVGVVVGYVTFLIFRISVHQNKFEWSGALSTITSLAGGGFLSYWSHPRNFAAYGIGYFVGFAAYWRFKQTPSVVTGSQAAPMTASLNSSWVSSRPEHLTLGSQAAPSANDFANNQQRSDRSKEDPTEPPPGFGWRVSDPEPPPEESD